MTDVFKTITMKNIILLLFFMAVCFPAFAQQKTFSIQQHSFIIKNKKVKNEWETTDEARALCRIVNGRPEQVLTFYAYKDEGGDCNNLFWDREWLKVQGNDIVITTRHFQKRNDPIPEWERRIYTVRKDGKVVLTTHHYKMGGDKQWKDKAD